jgi:FkbM family methyltransferase
VSGAGVAIEVERGGLRFAVNNRAQFDRIWQDVVDGREYEMGDLGLAPTIIDGGAHVGVASAWFARRYPGAVVLAFEPNPDTFALLVGNLRRNGLRRVVPFNAAIGPGAGPTPLWTIPGDSWGDATIRHGWHDGQPVRRVETVGVTLSSLLTGPVDLLKLDIEGVETQVLAEAAPRLDRVRRLVLEFHGSAANRANRLEEVLAVLERAGFRAQVEQDGKSVAPRRVRRDDPFWVIVRAWRPERGIGRKGPRR